MIRNPGLLFSFYFKSPMHSPGLVPEHDLFIQLVELKNTLRQLMGEQVVTHLEAEKQTSLEYHS